MFRCGRCGRRARRKVRLLAIAANQRRLRQQKRVLAIGAILITLEIGCGARCKKHHADYDVRYILTLSRGAAGGDVNLRAVEAQNAAALNARLEMANRRDRYITDGGDDLAIETAISQLHTHVYMHSPRIRTSTTAAAYADSRSARCLYMLGTPSSTVEFQPHRFVDITHYIEKKIDLIGAYKSQVDRMESIQPDVILFNSWHVPAYMKAARRWRGKASSASATAKRRSIPPRISNKNNLASASTVRSTGRWSEACAS
jgi:LmbE family N-acetylglucosaminyl deacetylase